MLGRQGRYPLKTSCNHKNLSAKTARTHICTHAVGNTRSHMFHVEQLRLPQVLEWVKKSVFLLRLSFRLSFYKLALSNPPYITNATTCECGKTTFRLVSQVCSYNNGTWEASAYDFAFALFYGAFLLKQKTDDNQAGMMIITAEI